MPSSHSQPQIATRSSWDVNAMPERKTRLPFQMTLSAREYQQLAPGHIPCDMDDKWFVFLENDWLFLHRSWTGHCVYQCRLAPDGNGYSVVETWANRDPKQYRETDDRYDCALLFFLISNLLLGQNTPFPLPGNLPPETPQGVYQHKVAGTGYAEIAIPEEKEAM